MKLNDLFRLIKDGESDTIEFKKQATGAIHKSIIGLANANGGHIIIGIDDDGGIIGTDTKTTKDRITNSSQSIIPKPEFRIHEIEIDDEELVIIEVKKSQVLCSVGGVAYIRIGSGIRPLSIQEILSLSSELGTVEWDRSPLVPIDNMREDYVDHFFEKREEVRGKKVKEKDRERFLRSMGAIKDDMLTNGGVLFFTDPQDILPQAKIRLVGVERQEPIWNKEFGGPLWKMIEDALEAVLIETRNPHVIISAERRVIAPYPSRILREAIINSVAHRNYVIGSDIRIFLRANQISVMNSGGLMAGVQLDDPEHVPRNPSICNLLYEIGLIERYGRGILMMRAEIEKNKTFGLEFDVRPNRFNLILKRNIDASLDQIDRRILDFLVEPKRSGEISKQVEVSKPTVLRHLKKLEALNLVNKMGSGSQIKYYLRDLSNTQ